MKTQDQVNRIENVDNKADNVFPVSSRLLPKVGIWVFQDCDTLDRSNEDETTQQGE